MTTTPESAAAAHSANSPRIGKFREDCPQYFIFVEKMPLCHVSTLCNLLMQLMVT